MLGLVTGSVSGISPNTDPHAACWPQGLEPGVRRTIKVCQTYPVELTDTVQGGGVERSARAEETVRLFDAAENRESR